VIDRPYFREILNQPFLFATRTGIDSWWSWKCNSIATH
jgi:hypothetical protein